LFSPLNNRNILREYYITFIFKSKLAHLPNFYSAFLRFAQQRNPLKAQAKTFL